MAERKSNLTGQSDVAPGGPPSASRAGGLLLPSLVLLGVYFLCLFEARSLDMWWHLLTGELIPSRGVPRMDWYSYSDSERPWIDVHWSFQLLLSWLNQLGGVPLIVHFKALAGAAAIGLLMFASGLGLSNRVRAVVWILPAIGLAGRCFVRPTILSLLYLAAFLCIFSAADRRRWLLLLLLPLQILWTNAHGLFVLGPVACGIWVLDCSLRKTLAPRFGLRACRLPWTIVLSVLPAVALATLINPYGLQGALFPLELYDGLGHAIAMEATPSLEYLRNFPGGYLTNYAPALLLLGVLATLSFVLQYRCTKSWSPLRLILLLAFGHLALRMWRNTDLFALVAGFCLAENLAACGSALMGSRNSGMDAQNHPRPVGGLAAWVLVLSFISFAWSGELAAKHGDGRVRGSGSQPDWYMHAAARFAVQEGFPKQAFVAHIGQAAVYLYWGRGQHRVFMDGRLEVASQATYENFVRAGALMAASDPALNEFLRGPTGELPAILLDSRSSRAQISGLLAMTDTWRLVFADPAGAVFLALDRAQELGLGAVSVDPLN